MIGLGELKVPRGAKKRAKRVGRGAGSGHGKTSCRGMKGQMSRSGASRRPGFEGGQMPLARRVPKRGFTNIFRKEYTVVNLGSLEEKFSAGDRVTQADMRKAGLVNGPGTRVKVLGVGSLSKALTVEADAFSASARQGIEKAGGQAVLC